MPLIGNDRLKKLNDLVLAGGHDVELAAHLGESIVDVRGYVHEILPKGIETHTGSPAEVANFAPELTDVSVGGSGEHTRGRRVLLTRLHPPSEVAHLLF
jgi:hypothetical protein